MKKYELGVWLVCCLIATAAVSQASAGTLTITITGSGSGLVAADTGTILWSGRTGAADYSLSTTVTLTAQPDEGVSFMGWSGACAGTGACSVTMDTARNVTALFSAVPRTGQTACYDSSGAVIACSGTGQDGELQTGVSLPDPRFTVATSGTGTVVIDNLTGLIWTQDGNAPGPPACGPATTKTWQGALDYVTCLNMNDYLGHNDWRLPNIRELISLTNKALPSTAAWLNTQGFTNAQAPYYWSSTTFGQLTNNAQVVDIVEGCVYFSDKLSSYYVWPVRSGPCGSSDSSTVCLPRTGQTTVYATGDDGSHQAGVAWPSPRFSVASSGTGAVVIDKLTGLMWAQDMDAPGPQACSPGGAKTWANALAYVTCINANNYLGRSDWRLPNMNELESLWNSGQSDQDVWLNTQGFIITQSTYHWSSTTYAGYTRYAWGDYVNYYLKGDAGDVRYVWPVRTAYSRTFTAISAPAIVYGTDGTVTVTVSAASSAPTGAVSLGIDGGPATSQVLSAVTGTVASAVFTISRPAAGAHALNAVYLEQNYFSASGVESTLAVNARTLHVTATGVDKVYDGATNAAVTFSDDRVAGDSLAVQGTANFADKNAGPAKTISVTGITVSGDAAGNYILSAGTATASANINARALTIAGMTANDRVYDGSETATLTGGTLTNVISGDTVSFSGQTGSFIDKNIGVAKAVIVSGVTLAGADAGNYTVTNPAGLTANITPRILTIIGMTANNKVYDGDAKAVLTGGTLSNVVSNDTVSFSRQRGLFRDKNIGSGKPVAVIGSLLTGADAGNYTVTNPAGIIADISARPLTITANAANRMYDGSTQASVTYADDRVPGDALTVSGTASFTDKNVGTAKAVTVTNITITGADSANYVLTATTASAAADIIAPDGDLDGGGVSPADALRALRIACGLVTPTATDRLHGDVAPLINGVPQPDDSIDIGDALVILRKSVGLVNW